MSMKAFKDMGYLYRTSAPLGIYLNYLKSKSRRKNIKIKHNKCKDDFRSSIQGLCFSNDWFSDNIPYWMNAFEKYFPIDKSLNVLEIGSWEGMSSSFILKTLPNAVLTCVDTWEGSDENKSQANVNMIETNFDTNIAPFQGRVKKFKGTSLSFFATCAEKAKFDLIYIDGSHLCDDVIVDAVKGFEQLKVDGLMIFDDYFWRYYKGIMDNPAAAINAFLKLKLNRSEIISLKNQLIIRKTR